MNYELKKADRHKQHDLRNTSVIALNSRTRERPPNKPNTPLRLSHQKAQWRFFYIQPRSAPTLLNIIAFKLDAGGGVGEGFAFGVVGEGAEAFGGVAEVKEHQDFFVFGETEESVEAVGIEVVDPAGVDAGVGGCEHQVGGYYRGVFYAGIPFTAGYV